MAFSSNGPFCPDFVYWVYGFSSFFWTSGCIVGSWLYMDIFSSWQEWGKMVLHFFRFFSVSSVTKFLNEPFCPALDDCLYTYVYSTVGW